MKKILLSIIGLLMVLVVSAQKNNSLALDENSKYIYYEVVNIPNTTADSLNKKAKTFVTSTYPKLEPQINGDTAVTVKSKVLTYSALAFAKHESGDIKYTLTIECRNNKYRYWLNNFVFIPYQKNRYGVFVPVDGIEIPLEKLSSKLDKKEADGDMEQLAAFCKQTGDNLKAYMAVEHKTNKPAQQQQPIKKVVT